VAYLIADAVAYLSAGLLVASVIQLLILLSWPAAHLGTTQAASGFRMMAGGMALMFGFSFSFLLLAMAGPVFAAIDPASRTALGDQPAEEGLRVD
jgi:hypothetical protein